MQHVRIGLLTAISAIGLVGCFTEPGDLGWDHDHDAGASGTGGPGTGATGGTSTAGTGGTSSAGTGGTSGTGGGCTNAEACGGDVVGSWVVVSSCLELSGDADVSSIGLGCDSIPITGYLEVTGLWTAYSDGTYLDQTTTTGQAELAMPESCRSISGTVVACNRIGVALEAMGYTSAICSDATGGGGCDCDVIMAQQGGMGVISVFPGTSGEYTVTGNVLTTESERPAEYTYCVAGSELTMRPITNTAGTVTGTIELSEQ